MVRHTLAAVAIAALALPTAHADAHSPGTPSFRFSGFGTLGVVHSSEDDADFIAHDLQGGGAGRDQDWSADVDTRLGLQLTAEFTERLTAVVQVLTEQRHDGSYRPGLEWANIKYDITPDFSVRAGRIVLPVFLTSDTRKVGYAQPWVRPPVELYSLIPITSSDGVDVTYRLRFGEVSHNLKAAYGGRDARTPDDGKAKLRDGWLLSDTVEYGPATFHLAYGRAKVTLEPYEPLFNTYRGIAAGAGMLAALAPAPFSAQFAQASAEAAAIVDRFEADSRRMDFIGLGASYDPGPWFLMAEWGQTDYNSIFGRRQAWYATAGLRWRAFTPYITYARARLQSRSSHPGVSATPVINAESAQLADAAAAANAALNAQLAGAPVQKTVSIGVRWDFAKNAALKLQYDHADISGNSPGTLDHPTAAFRPGGRYDVWSATVDFIF